MTRPGHRPGAGILFLLVASLFGAAVGLVIETITWVASAPDRGPAQARDHFAGFFEAPQASALAAAGAGAAVAFFVLGLVRGTFREVGVTVGTLVLVLLGGLTGAALGGAGFLIWWSVAVAGDSAAMAPTYLLRAFEVQPLLGAGALVGGGVFGITVTAFLVHNRATERFASSLVGGVVGASIGVFLYATARVTVDRFGEPLSTDWLRGLNQAVYTFSPPEIFFAGYGAAIGLVVARYRWRFHGIVTLVALLSVVTGYIMYTLVVTLPRVAPDSRPFAWILFAAETGSLLMVVLYSFYSIDVTSRKAWRRGPRDRPFSRHYVPRVAFQLPCYNEPAPVVIDTLRALMAVHYPKDRYLIMVLDDSTKPDSREPLEAFCKTNGITYLHRDNRQGFKAGALNHALRATSEDVDLLAIVDADYLVDPNYLRETVGYFADESLAWIQTPQDYRNPDQSFLTKQYHLADAYFYRAVMPSRNEENTIIFAGTMGIVRKQALLGVGGWGEKYITEDAELSLRLLLHGYSSVYINKTYGRGLIPPTFDGYKKQHYRWAFGGAKILRGHFLHLLFGRLTRRQAFDYFVGSVHWFEGLLILLIAGLLGFLAVAELAGLNLATHHSEEILLIGLIPFFVLTDGLTRLHTVMRHRLRLSILQTARVLGMWFSIKFSNATAATKALLGFNIPFVRTPKAPSRPLAGGEAAARALRVTKFETTMAAVVLLLTFALGARIATQWAATGAPDVPPIFLFTWIFYYFFVFFSAPLYAYKSYVTFRPDEERPVRPTRTPIGGRPGAA